MKRGSFRMREKRDELGHGDFVDFVEQFHDRLHRLDKRGGSVVLCHVYCTLCTGVSATGNKKVEGLGVEEGEQYELNGKIKYGEDPVSLKWKLQLNAKSNANNLYELRTNFNDRSSTNLLSNS